MKSDKLEEVSNNTNEIGFSKYLRFMSSNLSIKDEIPIELNLLKIVGKRI